MPKSKSRKGTPSATDWQPPAGKGAAGFRLKDIDPAAKPWSTGDTEVDRAAVEELAVEIDRLQDLLYADRRHAVLVVLQGTDAAGKDGTLRSVFARTSPLGVHTVGWRAPSEEERSHDYLWRIHKAAPARGEMTVFNRSHYEDVLVPVVNGWITPEDTALRYRQINDFERMLAENGTVILKFMLHISSDEQRARLQERLDDPAKRWKFSLGDLDVRRQWADYQQAYEALLRATSTSWAPWTVVPADSKTHRNLMIATLVRDAMKKLELRYPPGDAALQGVRVE
jgi:PPK2 family polyphosphate:nucleotide phosphotransferase